MKGRIRSVISALAIFMMLIFWASVPGTIWCDIEYCEE